MMFFLGAPIMRMQILISLIVWGLYWVHLFWETAASSRESIPSLSVFVSRSPSLLLHSNAIISGPRHQCIPHLQAAVDKLQAFKVSIICFSFHPCVPEQLGQAS